ncbi:MAG TPA: hypothetical protein VIJ76_04275 [Galbitalea sp.]
MTARRWRSKPLLNARGDARLLGRRPDNRGSPGCLNWALLAYGANNQLVAQLQAPICKVDGHGTAWTITTK